MNIANLNKNNTKMPYKQLSFILTILLLHFTFSFACSPAVNPTDNNTVFTPSLHIKVSDGSTDITDSLSIAVDENDTTKIIISGLSNSVAPNKTYTLTITPLDNIFSTTDGKDISIDITAPITTPDGFLSGDGVLSQGDGVPLPDQFTITNNNDPEIPISYTVVVPFSAAPVEDWLTSESLSTYITATFASQTASLILNGYTLSVNDLTNAIDGTGSISFNLPQGFEAIPASITLPDPDGSSIAAATIIPSSSTFTISESDNTKNSQTYTIDTIDLAAITVFTPRVHITITDNSPTPNDITIDVNTENLITITGLSNAVGENKEYTLTINSVTDLFSTGDNPITITIRDPDGFSPGGGLLSQGNGDPSSSASFTITNNIDPSTSIIYTVEVQFSGAPVQDWLTEMTFPNYFTGATFSGQTLDSTLDNTVLSFNFDGDSDRYIIAIDGSSISNLQNGILRLTTIDDMPEGYTLTQNLNDPDGNGLAALTDEDAGTITIAEEGNEESNTKTYDVTISLAAYRSPVMASHISVTGFDDSPIDSNNIDIQIVENIITISGSDLINGTSGRSSVTIAPPTTGEYTVEPDSLTFDDPDGTDMAEHTVGTVNIVSPAGFTVSHTVRLSLEAYESPVDASHVTAEFESITAGPANITISGTEIIIRGFPNIDGSAGTGSVTITEPTTMEFTVSPIDPPSFPFSFTDPEGTDSQDKVAGTVNVTSAGKTALHTIIIKFSDLISLKITSDNVVNNPLTITSGGIVTITNLGACELLPLPDFEVDGNPATVTGFPSYFDRRIDDIPTGSDSYTLDRVLKLVDASGDFLDETFSVRIEGFPACDDVSIFTSSGKTGDAADTAYEIDSAPKLELLSHLVLTDNANTVSKFYKLTDDIDLGLAGLPWSEEASGETGEGFPPIGITDVKFQGTFDCANNSISNLYINKANDDFVGLIGFASGANIQNCSLINVNVTGNEFVGGLVGSLAPTANIDNSYATGSVSGTSQLGGLAGRLNSSTITNSYATGIVSGEYDVGGLAGRLLSSSRIENSYAIGSVSGTTQYGTTQYVGGLVGFQEMSTITNSYWDKETSDQMTSAGVGDGAAVGKTTTDLQSGSVSVGIFTGWNSPPDDNVWEFSPDTQYPRLKTVVCANRQYADPNNVPTACEDLP